MAESLNGNFSSVFTRYDISSLPVPDAQFQEAKSDYLGQLILTPEMVAKKIKAMKDDESPGVDGIPPKLLMEIVDQISKPLTRVLNLSLKEGVVPYRPVSLVLIIRKVNYRPNFLVRHKLLNPSQHGFLKARSCLTNMLCVLEETSIRHNNCRRPPLVSPSARLTSVDFRQQRNEAS